jgi:hypothetical protein
VHHLIGYCAGPCLPIRIPAPAAGPIRPDWLGMLAPGMPGRSPHRGDGGGQDAAQSSPTAQAQQTRLWAVGRLPGRFRGLTMPALRSEQQIQRAVVARAKGGWPRPSRTIAKLHRRYGAIVSRRLITGSSAAQLRLSEGTLGGLDRAPASLRLVGPGSPL